MPRCFVIQPFDSGGKFDKRYLDVFRPAILAAGLKPYRAYLLGISLVLVGVAFWLTYGRMARQRAECKVRFGRTRRVVLWASGAFWIIAVAIQLAADRYWL